MSNWFMCKAAFALRKALHKKVMVSKVSTMIVRKRGRVACPT